MIKRNGKRIAAIAMAAALLGQNIQPVLALGELNATELVELETVLNTENGDEDSLSDSQDAVEEESEELKEDSEVNNEIEEGTTPTEDSVDDQVSDNSDNNEKESKTTIDFKVMATSDLHANLMNYDYYTGSTTNNSGLVKAATVIKEEKAKANKSKNANVDNVLLVDNGDTIQGTPLANLYAIKQPVKPGQKYPVYEALESLGYDMTTIGNHEVNYGMDFIKQITKANTSMGMVCANLRDAKTKELVFDPYKIVTEKVVDSNGVERELKIGVTGVVPTQILNWDKVILNGEVTVDEMDEAVKTYTKEMKDKGADIVVVLAHTGYGDETTDVKGAENAGYAISMIDDVDVVVGGHVHRSAKYNVKKSNGDITQYVQPLNNAKEVGVVDLKIDVIEDGDDVTYAINDSETKINNISTKGKENDEATEAVVKEYHEATDAYVNEKSGEVTKDLNSFFTLVADDPSIQIVSDAQKAYVEKLIEDNDPSLVKYSDLPILSAAAPFKAGSSAGNYVDIKAGGLAIRDLSNLYKYDNTMAVIKLTGADVKEWLEFCANMFNTIDPNSTKEQDLINRDFPTFNFDVIDGVEYEIDVTQEPKYDKKGNVINENSSRIYNLTYNGKPIDLEQEFLIATNNYRAGGDSFPWNGRQVPVYTTTDESRDVLKKYIEDAGKLEPSVDNNWKFKTIDTDTKVYFTSHENGVNYLANYPAISTNKEVAGEQLYKYYYDLSATQEKEDTNKITILHTNDTHGRLKADSSVIGIDTVAAIKNNTENSILVDAGDTIHGLPFVTLSKGQDAVDLLNAAGYEYIVPGNHDFNYGYSRLMELFKNSVSLKNGENKLRLLASNVKKDGQSVFESNNIKEMEVNGKTVKVGFFGIATQETAYKTNPNNVKGIEFTSPIDAAKEQVAELEKQGADVIVALSHVGTDESSNPTAYDVINAVDGIDVYVDGHSHTTFKNGDKVNDTLLVSTGEYLSNLGKVELELDENNEVLDATASLITKEEALKVTPDANVKAKIAEIDAKQGDVLSEVVGKTTIDLDGDRNSVRFGETNLGNLITDAMISETGADIAITNGGGIRASIKAGDITKGDIVSVLPFGNYIVTKQLTGAQIKQILEFGVRSYGESLGGFPHVAGIKFVVDPSKKVGDRIISLTINGKDLDMNKTYTVATNDFMAAGGDDYPCFGDVPTLNEYSSLEESLVNFIKTLGTVNYTKQGRILAGTMIGNAIKVEVESEYLKDILLETVKNGYTVESVQENGKSLIKVYNSKIKNKELIAILEVKDMSIEDVKAMVNAVIDEVEAGKPGNGGSNSGNQNGDNNNNNGNGGSSNGNQNGNKPSNPQTGDISILGYIGMGVTAVAGILTNNRRKK
ncbi:Trifunctional nucleotide phosphoesterase protein YfkN precursor [uncultured Clostridium sp.]|nr:Trifunctional nucleotide phosphoesterase protein YfkN precursor [uncultured Clostridium sp.]